MGEELDTDWGGWLPPVDASAGDTAGQTDAEPDGDEPVDREPTDDQIGALEGLIEDYRDEPEIPSEVASGDDEAVYMIESPEELTSEVPEELEREDPREPEPPEPEPPEPEEEFQAPPQSIACPGCGEPCPEEARFCLHCGAPLVEGAVPAGPPLVATAVACEVPGAESGPLDRARTVLERRGGSVRPLEEDPATLVAVFDPDLEDSALRAVRAAADARDAIRGTATVRAGVGTCEISPGAEPDRAVDLAVRLQRMASAGEIIVGEALYHLIGAGISVEPVDPSATLDGDGPVGPLRLLGIAYDAPAPGLGEATLVGRHEELEHVKTVFDRAVSERSGAIVDIVGPPGIGKSRLAEEFVRGLDGAIVVQVRYRPAEEGGAGWLLPEMAQAMGEHVDEPTPAGIRRAIAGGAEPLVVWIDDADRAGSGFHETIAELVASVNDAPLLVLRTGTAAPADAADVMRLEALADEDMEALAGELVGDVGGLVRLARSRGGDPFALEQTLALLIEQGRLAMDRGRWVLSPDLSPTGVPEGVRELLQARIHSLPLDERAVIGLAAVVGEEFPWAPMEDLLPESARPAVRDHLEALAERYLLRPHEGSAETFAFRHASIREAALATVPDDARAEVHERFARWLESAQSGISRVQELVGAHLAAAARLRPPGRERDELARRAAAFLVRAGDQAESWGDVGGAALLLGRAASLLPEADPERPELLLRTATASAEAGHFPEAERFAEESARVAGSRGDRAAEWRARVFRASVRIREAGYYGALESARSTADRAIERLSALGDERGLAAAWALLAQVHQARGYAAGVAVAAERAAEHASRAGRPKEQAEALGRLARAVAEGPIPIEEAIDRCERIASELPDDPAAETEVLGALAHLRAKRGAFGEARELASRALDAAERLGSAEAFAASLHSLGTIEALSGEPVAAEEALRRGEAVGKGAASARIAASLAHISCERGDAEEALALAESAELSAASDDAATRVASLTARARALVLVARIDEADAIARHALRLAEQTDSPELRAEALLVVAEVERAAGRPNEATPFVRRAIRLFERRGSAVWAAKARAQLEGLTQSPEPTLDPD
jgi:predicted ATPase